MADTTDIAWCDATLNLWFGCTQVSPACDHCYAMRWGPRLGVKWNGPPKRAADSAFDKIAAYQRSAVRYRLKHGRQRRVFINSLSDFFDNQAEQEWRDIACREFELASDVVFILVTKRPQNVTKMVPKGWCKPGGWPANVWLLVTAENQVEYDRRIAALLAIPGPVVRGFSMEPMLELIHPDKSVSYSNRERAEWAGRILKRDVDWDTVGSLWWGIIGGESGRGARPMPDLTDVINLSRRFQAGDVSMFIKQMSQADFPTTFKDHSTFPYGLRSRSFPA